MVGDGGGDNGSFGSGCPPLLFAGSWRGGVAVQAAVARGGGESCSDLRSGHILQDALDKGKGVVRKRLALEGEEGLAHCLRSVR